MSIGSALTDTVGSIPDDAPFSPEQRSWLDGFFAGMSTRLLEAAPDVPAGGSTARDPLHILFGSQTGNSEDFALEAVATARSHGLVVTTASLDEVSVDDLEAFGRVLVVCSTYGEGEMPDNAELFWESLAADTAPRLEGLAFSVLALGDSSYDGFCQAGKLIDMRLEQLGAERLAARVDCDVDFEDAAAEWLTTSLAVLDARDGADSGADGSTAGSASTPGAPAREKSAWSRKRPFVSTLAASRVLSGAGSAKEIRHYEFDLADSGLVYEAGDALGVVPENDPALVDQLLARLGWSADTVHASSDATIGDLLTRTLEIRNPSRELVTEIAKRAASDELSSALRLGEKDAVDRWMWGKDILDLLLLDDTIAFDPDDLLALLKPLQHRAYSISSSPLAADGRVHLTVASVRYSSNGRMHGGVASTHLADRIASGGSAGVFVSRNSSFRVPTDDDAPMIMVGPGTGIAPFRAFLQERRERGAAGSNWLFFGDQHRASDFIYEDELAEFSAQGVLSHLDLAFSRDQTEKVYVQNRMAENGRELFDWLENGGHFYVCGDASRMAKDVDDALHSVIAVDGGLGAEKAVEYVNTLKREKRYVRDVY